MTTPNADQMLDRVRKLLALAEDDAATLEEAQAFTAKASELMAKYGIDRALLADTEPGTDKPGNKKIAIPNPWGREKAHLLCGLASAMRCQAILLNSPGGVIQVHLFGYESDIERTEILYTSILLQLAHALARVEVPAWSNSPRAFRRSWILGYTTAVIARVRLSERTAETAATETAATRDRTAIVLADRSLVNQAAAKAAYPTTRKTRITYSGSGYRDGYERGQRANLGGTGVGRRSAGALR